MKILILSDQHFYNLADTRSDLFVSVLKKIRLEKLHPGVKELWLMGDVFDMVIGNFSFWEKIHKEIFEEFRAWTRAGKKIVYLEGNHDFLIKDLMENLDIEVYENPTWYVLPQSQERVYLAHGDQVDDNNKAYIKWRQTIRGTAFRSVVRNCPEKIAHKVLLPIGEKLSHQSRALNRLANLEAYKQMFREFAFKRMSEGARAVFLGHSHVFDSYEQSEPAATSSFYINLGSWLEPTKRYAIWDLTANKNAEVFNL